MVEPLCKVLDIVFAATACGLDFDTDRVLLGLGETFFENGYRDPAKLGSFETVCKLFGYFESKAHSLVKASPVNNFVGNSVARFIQRNLMDMDFIQGSFVKEGLLHKDDFSQLSEKARLRLALSLSHDEVKRVLLEGYPSLRGPTFSNDLGL